MTVARIKDAADAVAAKLVSDWAPADPDGVVSTWAARLSFDVNDPVTLLTGRRVFVLPVSPELTPLTRGSWRNKYTVCVLVAERYADAGDPPDEWIDDLMSWWEQTILFPLCNPALVLTGPGGVVSGVIPDPETPPEVVGFVDRPELVENKAVMLAVNFTYIDASDHTGAG